MSTKKFDKKCLICSSKMEYYFSKEYIQKPYHKMMKDIGKVDYYKCEFCGFVFSKTHYECPTKQLEKLNFDYHHFLEAFYAEECNKDGFRSHQPPYLQQATMIAILSLNNIIDTANMLDYAGGYGTLSKILQKYFNIQLPVYDPYVQSKDINYKKIVVWGEEGDIMKFDVVINSAMFEHIIYRSDIDKVNNLVADDKCLILHTLICEKIPKDPNWFYIDPPVHCAFHTNKSMDILMKQWDYKSSLYCPMSKCWVLFKKEPHNIKNKIMKINQELQEQYFTYKIGFVDYWKGF